MAKIKKPNKELEVKPTANTNKVAVIKDPYPSLFDELESTPDDNELGDIP